MGETQELSKIEQITMGMQTLLSDKLLNQVNVDWERDASLRSYLIRTQWQTASRVLNVERNGRMPATFWDYIKKYLPFMKPNMVDVEIKLIHQCPHRMVLEQDPHLKWLEGRSID